MPTARGAKPQTPVPTRKHLGFYVHALQAMLDQSVGWITEGAKNLRPRLVVTDYKRLSEWSPAQPAILVLPHAEYNVTASFQSIVAARNYARVYGFVDAITAFNRFALTGVFGDVAFAPTEQSGDVHAFIAPTPPVPMPAMRTMLAFKRAAFWRNKPRLRAIAGIATAVLEGDSTSLLGYGLRIEEKELPGTVADRLVAILVESLDQGKRLQRMLPNWPLLTRSSGQEEQAIAEEAKGVIATLVYAARNTVLADVLIRATGGKGEILVTGFPAFIGGDAALVIEESGETNPRRLLPSRGWARVGPTRPSIGENPRNGPTRTGPERKGPALSTADAGLHDVSPAPRRTSEP